MVKACDTCGIKTIDDAKAEDTKLGVEEKEVAGNDVKNDLEGKQTSSKAIDGSVVASKRPPYCFTEENGNNYSGYKKKGDTHKRMKDSVLPKAKAWEHTTGVASCSITSLLADLVDIYVDSNVTSSSSFFYSFLNVYTNKIFLYYSLLPFACGIPHSHHEILKIERSRGSIISIYKHLDLQFGSGTSSATQGPGGDMASDNLIKHEARHKASGCCRCSINIYEKSYIYPSSNTSLVGSFMLVMLQSYNFIM
ncbi:hypothetical protein CRYUN_Cryun18bG0065200 [Craigia yunnanensis]